MGRDKFLHGAMILTLAGLVVKIIGSVNAFCFHVYWVARALACIKWLTQYICCF